MVAVLATLGIFPGSNSALRYGTGHILKSPPLTLKVAENFATMTCEGTAYPAECLPIDEPIRKAVCLMPSGWYSSCMKEASAQFSKLIAARTSTEFNRSCMSLSEEARTLQVLNEGMNRLGLNAQVLAAQTKQRGGLEVVVTEIVRLSHAIRDVLGALGDAAKALSQSSVAVLNLTNLDISYAIGIARGIAPGSEEIYRKAYSGIRSRKKSHLVELTGRLQAVSRLVDDLGRIALHIPPVTVMIRIVVSESEAKTGELLGTVDELKAFHGHLDAKIARMRQVHGVCTGYFKELEMEGR